jgi:hypothetical protein
LTGARQELAVVQGRDAEVGEDGAAVTAQQHVGGLDVPVQSPDRVDGVQRVDQLQADGGGLLRCEGSGLGRPIRQ